VREGVLDRVHSHRAIAGVTEKLDRAWVARFGEVHPDLARVLVAPLGVEPLQGLADPAVKLAPPSLEDRAIGGVLGERVTEREAPLGIAPDLAHQLQPLQGRELLVELAVQLRDLLQDAVAEGAADHRGGLQRAPCRLVQPVDARGDQRVHALRDRDVRRAIGDPPAGRPRRGEGPARR